MNIKLENAEINCKKSANADVSLTDIQGSPRIRVGRRNKSPFAIERVLRFLKGERHHDNKSGLLTDHN